MSLIFTKAEDDKIEELQGEMDLALKNNWFSMSEDYRDEIKDITEAAIVRTQTCLLSFMAARNGNLPAALTVQAI